MWLCLESFLSLHRVSRTRWSLGYDGQMWDCKSALSNKHSLFDALDCKPLFVVYSSSIFCPLPLCQVEPWRKLTGTRDLWLKEMLWDFWSQHPKANFLFSAMVSRLHWNLIRLMRGIFHWVSGHWLVFQISGLGWSQSAKGFLNFHGNSWP